MAVTRSSLQSIARLRVQEARSLLKSRQYAGAFYLAGYAVECALKACVAKTVARYEFPDKKKADRAWDHDIAKLAKLAGLEVSLQHEKANPLFDANWSIVVKWNPEDRYRESVSKNEATSLYQAITARRNGVLKWIRGHW